MRKKTVAGDGTADPGTERRALERQLPLISWIGEKFAVIDGSHRVQALRRLLETDHKHKEELK
jgi:hypothetical protein